MKIILAEINGTPELAVRQAIKLKKTCEVLGVEHPINVHSAEELIDVLGACKNRSILLFSNFPPNSSYPVTGKSSEITDEGNLIPSSWKAEYYTVSRSLFEAIKNRYSFKAIHFITGAHPFSLGDDLIKSLLPDIPITVSRKKEWKEAKSDYQEQYRSFVEEKIKEALLK